jgi:hypothetical protein
MAPLRRGWEETCQIVENLIKKLLALNLERAAA